MLPCIFSVNAVNEIELLFLSSVAVRRVSCQVFFFLLLTENTQKQSSRLLVLQSISSFFMMYYLLQGMND